MDLTLDLLYNAGRQAREIPMLIGKLNEELAKASLPAVPKLLGKSFEFYSQHGSHFRTIVGTVIGVQLSDEGGLELEISNRETWGVPIRSITYSEKEWRLRFPDNESLLGTFELL